MPDIERSKNRAYDLLAGAEAALEAGEIDEDGWYERVAAVITPAYLAADNPRSQSGKSGDDAEWEYSRSQIADAIDRDGSFLDVGCASGYLMETLDAWCAAKGVRIEPYGLDIAPELADLARRRLPQWADRIYVGNGLTWLPPKRFDFVRFGLEYVPQRRQADLTRHLLENAVAPGGRLIIGVQGEARPDLATEPSLEELVTSWGFAVSGRSERPHLKKPHLRLTAFWIDVGTVRKVLEVCKVRK